MKRRLRSVSLYFAIIICMSLLSQNALADPTIYIQPVQPSIPQNQQQTNSFIVDMIGSPTNTIPSNTAGYFIDKYVQNQNAIRDSYLATARSYQNAAVNSEKAYQRMLNAQDAASAANMKGMGSNYANKAFSTYCIAKDVYEYNNPSNHKHSSLAFIDQTLRGYSIISSSLDTAGVKMAKPLALGSGLMKDAFGSNTFANWANQQNNVVLDFADWTIDGVNDGTTYAFSFYMDLFNHTDDANVNGRPPYGVGVYKPNIYIYPTVRTDITVTFGLPATVTKTIPEYEGKWQVTACPDGSLMDKTGGNAYNYLFYESETDPALFNYDSGWVIRADSRKAQFREILLAYGFKEKEISDFIDFWAAKLLPGIDYVMYPQLTETVDRVMPVNVYPAPDNRFRLWFAFKAFNGQAPVLPEARSMNRNGYAFVEWGGFIIE